VPLDRYLRRECRTSTNPVNSDWQRVLAQRHRPSPGIDAGKARSPWGPCESHVACSSFYRHLPRLTVVLGHLFAKCAPVP
jgi:hypothetical protein